MTSIRNSLRTLSRRTVQDLVHRLLTITRNFSGRMLLTYKFAEHVLPNSSLNADAANSAAPVS